MNNGPDSFPGSNSKRSERIKDAASFLGDQIISGVFVGPLTVFAWWGIWGYLNSHLFPDRMDISGFICYGIGNGGLMILAFTQSLWKRYLSVNNALHWIFGYHFFTAICLFCNVCHWRGMWLILDYYTGFGAISCWVTYAIGQGMLWIFRSSKSAQAPPMIVVYDREPEHFSYSTRFRTKPQFSEKYVFDVAFTVMIIHQLVVFYWRGSWALMDLYIFPDNKTYSAVVSFGFAYGLMILLCVVQPLFNFLYRRFASTKNSHRRFLCRWLLEAVTYFFSNLVNVGVWRGVWLICDVYVLPDQPDLAHGVILGTGFVGLWLMMSGNSVAIRGCDIDGETDEDEETVCMCQNLYLRRFFTLSKCDKPTTKREDVEQQTKTEMNIEANDETIIDNSKPVSLDTQNGEIVSRF